jgi:hypothetical protein
MFVELRTSSNYNLHTGLTRVYSSLTLSLPKLEKGRSFSRSLTFFLQTFSLYPLVHFSSRSRVAYNMNCKPKKSIHLGDGPEIWCVWEGITQTSTHEHTQIHTNTLEYTRSHTNTHGRTRTHINTQTHKHTNTPEHINTLENTRARIHT